MGSNGYHKLLTIFPNGQPLLHGYGGVRQSARNAKSIFYNHFFSPFVVIFLVLLHVPFYTLMVRESS